jgi:hypothetical protein
VAQPSSSLVLGGSMPLSAGSVSHFSASATEARNAPPSPPTPTLAHSSANGVHLPNMWLSNKWGRAQHSEGMYGGFGANAARREPVVSSVDLQVRPRWRERDNSGSGPGPGTAASVGAGGGTSGTGGTGTGPGSGSGSSSTSAATNGGFIYGSSATSLHMNGLNGFGPVNGSTHFSHGLNHGLTSPRGNVSVVGAASGGLGGDRSPSPAAPLFNSSTGAPASANGGGGPATKDYSPFSYDYDRYREERRDAREVSPLTREPMRVPGPSSSAPNQPDTALNYNHFGSPQPLTQPQSQQHVGNHFANPFSGGSEYARLTPFPPRLTPTATLRPQHQPYGETGYAPAYEHGQTSYASWPSMHPPPSNLLVPEMNGMGPLSGVGSIRPHEDIHYAWTSTPPPLAGSSVEMEGRSHSVSGPVVSTDCATFTLPQSPPHFHMYVRPRLLTTTQPKPKPQRRFPCPDCNEAFTRRNDLVVSSPLV